MQASDFKQIVSECCTEVLESMYFASVLESSSRLGMQAAVEPGQIAFILRFDGVVCGTFGLALDPSLARTLAANFLGEEEETLTETEVAEVAGELTNMFCGSVVSRVEGTTKFVLSHPEPFTACAPELDVLTSELETDSGLLRTWIAIDAPLATLQQAPNETLQAAH